MAARIIRIIFRGTATHVIQIICCCDSVSVESGRGGKVYPDDDAEVEDLIDDAVLSPTWWTFGEEGAEDSGVAISSMSEYSPDLEPFLLKALLKELRNCMEKKYETEQLMHLKTLN